MDQAAAQDELQLEERAARRAAAGDEAAFAELYRRHFQGVHDFAARMVHDRELAGEVVQSSFVKAWESLRSGREVTSVKPWLYAIARNAAIDELRRRGRERPAGHASEEGEEPSPFARPDPARLSDPGTVIEDREFAELVWAAAAGLSPGDYALLDMHLRRDLDADEIADALGLRKGAVYTRLSRMKDALEESVAALLLIRRGRRECPELDALLTELGEQKLSPDGRRAVLRHARRCEHCAERRRRFAAPAEVLGALAPVPVLPGVEDAAWAAVSSAVRDGAVAHEGPDAGFEVLGWWRATSPAARLKLLAGLGAVAALAGALLLLDGSAVVDPSDLHSTSHRVGVPTTRSMIDMTWSPSDDASGYSVRWSRSPEVLPDTTPDVPGYADSTTTTLAPGRWYFTLRTRGSDGEWTATVRVGPYVIERAEPPTGDRPRRRRPDRDEEPGTDRSQSVEEVSRGSRAPEPAAPRPRQTQPQAPQRRGSQQPVPRGPQPSPPEDPPPTDSQQDTPPKQPEIQPPDQNSPVVPP